MSFGALTPTELDARMKRGEPLLLIDCRENDEWEICRIPGAKLVPLSKFAELIGPQLPSRDDIPIVIYCHHGMRSARAANYLAGRGVAGLLNLTGGIEAWAKDVDPTMRRY